MKSEDAEGQKFTMGELMDPDHPRREEMINKVTQFFEEKEAAFRRIVSNVNPFDRSHETYQSLSKLFFETAITIKRTNKRRQALYPKIAENLDFLANHCWFLSLEVHLPDFEEQALVIQSIPDYENNIAAIDQCFIAFYKEHFESLSASIVASFPDRAFAIQPAIAAHARGEYALSVPIFFAQADGILLKLTERELFTSRRHISSWIKEKWFVRPDADEVDLLYTAAWAALDSKLPVGWSPDERKANGYTGLNRNTVLHGLDLEYATEVNSYKAFSLLAYIASLDEVIKLNSAR